MLSALVLSRALFFVSPYKLHPTGVINMFFILTKSLQRDIIYYTLKMEIECIMYYLTFTDKLGGRQAQKIETRQEATHLFKHLAKRVREIALYRDARGFHSTTQVKFLILWSSPDGKCYWGNGLTSFYVSEKEKKEIKAKRYFVPI